MVNWIHNVEPKELKLKLNEYFFYNLKPNGEIIIDTVQDKEYQYNHSITYLTSEMKAKILEGKLSAYWSERVLLNQAFIKNPELTITNLLQSAVQKFGEKIEIGRFVRFSVSQ